MPLPTKKHYNALIPLIFTSFWGMWYAIAAYTNLLDFAYKLGWLSPFWRYRSSNFDIIGSYFMRFDISLNWVYPLLSIGILAEITIAILFFWTAFRLYQGKSADRSFYPAFLFSMTFWCAFLVLDELIISYSLASTHLRLLIATMVTLLLIKQVQEA